MLLSTEIQFKSLIGIKISPFLSDHRVCNKAILPATYYLEIVMSAGKNVFESDTLTIEKFVIHQALIMPEQGEISVQIKLFQQENNSFSWQIHSKDDSKSSIYTLNASGIIANNSRQQPAAIPAIDNLKTQGQAIAIADFYQTCRNRQIQYGDRFQVLEALYAHSQSALGRVCLDSTLTESSSYLIHPVLLDSCLQVLWAALPASLGEETYLPVGIENLVVHRYPDANARYWSYAEISPQLDLSGKVLLADLYLLDEQGCLAELRGVAVEKASSQGLSEALGLKQNMAIAASFTAEPIADALRFWTEELELPSKLEFTPYNQIFQELLNPQSILAQNQTGANIILLRLEDWARTKQLQPIVDAEQKQKILGNLPTHQLPQGLEVAHLNPYETEYLYQELFVDRVYARHNIALPDDACVVDIGANIGLFTLFIQQECANATVYAFEPAPHAFAKLKANAELYCQNAHLFNCGLSGADKQETFTFYPNSSVFSGFHADQEDDEQAIRAVILNMLQQVQAGSGEELEKLADEFMPGRLEVESFQAQLRTLSSIIEEHKIERIDLLKLDAEKSELPVLQGIKPQHWSIIQQMVVEVHDREGSTIRQVKQLLIDQGFQLIVEEETLLQGSGLYNIYASRPHHQPEQVAPVSATIDRQALEQNIQDLGQALITAAQGAAVPYVVCLCPASTMVAADPQRSSLYRELEQQLALDLEQVSNIHLLEAAEVAAQYPVAEYYDSQGDKSGSVPYTPEYYTALGTAIARKIYALKTPPYKVIVLDCDRTLWDGICGEDGASAVTVDGVYRQLQEFMVAQSEAGMLLCLCSKNNEADVWQVFESQEMPLQRQHLVQWRINWQPKSENLKSLAAELNLGLDSLIFIDDNPLECAEVQANCSQVLTLQLPEPSAQIPQFLNQMWAFDRLQHTAADRQRTALYQQNLKRESYRDSAITLTDFLAGLNLQVKITPIAEPQITRVAQLTQRTNQFNLTTIRRSAGEIQQLLLAGNGLAVEASDRFGDYGLVGAVLFETVDQKLRVDTFLLSCRALGKGIEHQMLAQLGEIAISQDLEEIELTYVATAKNQPALNFLEQISANADNAIVSQTATGWQFKLPASLAANLTYSPESTTVTKTKVTNSSPAVGRQKQQQTLTRIATDLYEPQQILKLIAAGKQRSRPAKLTTQFASAANEIETWLVQIWRELLGIEQIGTQDNFFELGGTSLLMVQVLSKIQAKYPQVTLVDLYQYPTIAAQGQYLNPSDDQASAVPAFQAVGDRARRQKDARKRRQRRGGRS